MPQHAAGLFHHNRLPDVVQQRGKAGSPLRLCGGAGAEHVLLHIIGMIFRPLRDARAGCDFRQDHRKRAAFREQMQPEQHLL